VNAFDHLKQKKSLRSTTTISWKQLQQGEVELDKIAGIIREYEAFLPKTPA
jgi:hypothetical protein